MISILVAIFCIFPISFFAFVLSERVNATHQARVGKAIHIGSFFVQSWTDTIFEIKTMKNKWLLLVTLLQAAIVFFFDFDLELVFFGYLILNGLVLVGLSQCDLDRVEQRIESDRGQMRFLVGSLLATVSAMVCFVASGTTSLSMIVWSPAYLLFLPLFVTAGMILLGEYPFVGLGGKNKWVDSLRFYVWCALASQLFLGGGFFFVDLHLKALALFVGFRLVARYFPSYTQRDVFRLGVIYLIPISVVLWLLVAIVHGVWSAGGFNV